MQLEASPIGAQARLVMSFGARCSHLLLDFGPRDLESRGCWTSAV